jgi:hypothetical protein
MTNVECRMAKGCRSQNDENIRTLPLSGLVIRISFDIRHLCFVIIPE